MVAPSVRAVSAYSAMRCSIQLAGRACSRSAWRSARHIWRLAYGPFAFIDMLPRGGWDGRIRFVKAGDPPPGSTEPERPEHGGGHGDDAGDGEEESESEI
jgi:hypothetical protein